MVNLMVDCMVNLMVSGKFNCQMMVKRGRRNPGKGWEVGFRMVPGRFETVILKHWLRSYRIHATAGVGVVHARPWKTGGVESASTFDDPANRQRQERARSSANTTAMPSKTVLETRRQCNITSKHLASNNSTKETPKIKTNNTSCIQRNPEYNYTLKTSSSKDLFIQATENKKPKT